MTVRRLITSSDIATGEIKEFHIDDAQIKTRHIEDYAITDAKIATGALRAAKLDGDVFATDVVGPIPNTDTEYAFGKTLVGDPRVVTVHPTTDGVLDVVYEVAVSRTSITLRAGTSGVYARYCVWV